eukprot:TRINITY_DN26718_c0_g1_i1.p1 TRINITY_DN26718_c0_g1~~TRINITY_DN26718_c0_g1_i1.p1  ORF type:complete len:751 (+),score=123.12 TRINITY_DN26718_c0_g1_i1:159-2411(+)
MRPAPPIAVWDRPEDVSTMHEVNFRPLQRKVDLHRRKLEDVKGTLDFRATEREVAYLTARSSQARRTRLRKQQAASEEVMRENLRMVERLGSIMKESAVRQQKLLTQPRALRRPQPLMSNLPSRRKAAQRIDEANAAMFGRLVQTTPRVVTCDELDCQYREHRAHVTLRQRTRHRGVVKPFDSPMPPPGMTSNGVASTKVYDAKVSPRSAMYTLPPAFDYAQRSRATGKVSKSRKVANCSSPQAEAAIVEGDDAEDEYSSEVEVPSSAVDTDAESEQPRETNAVDSILDAHTSEIHDHVDDAQFERPAETNVDDSPLETSSKREDAVVDSVSSSQPDIVASRPSFASEDREAPMVKCTEVVEEEQDSVHLDLATQREAASSTKSPRETSSELIDDKNLVSNASLITPSTDVQTGKRDETEHPMHKKSGDNATLAMQLACKAAEQLGAIQSQYEVEETTSVEPAGGERHSKTEIIIEDSMSMHETIDENEHASSPSRNDSVSLGQNICVVEPGVLREQVIEPSPESESQVPAFNDEPEGVADSAECMAIQDLNQEASSLAKATDEMKHAQEDGNEGAEKHAESNEMQSDVIHSSSRNVRDAEHEEETYSSDQEDDEASSGGYSGAEDNFASASEPDDNDELSSASEELDQDEDGKQGKPSTGEASQVPSRSRSGSERSSRVNSVRSELSHASRSDSRSRSRSRSPSSAAEAGAENGVEAVEPRVQNTSEPSADEVSCDAESSRRSNASSRK